jgi:hypothetical protein
MDNQRRKAKRRTVLSESTSGLDGVIDQRETITLHQEVDMEWLADEYRRRTKSESSLTLEIFADQYGISADELREYLPELSSENGDSITLWHGTTRSRAESILVHGFDGRRAPVYFAQGTRIPRAAAQSRAASEHDEPVVIMCSIDINRYDQYRRQGRGIYAFSHRCIGGEVVKEVINASGKLRAKKEGVELTNVTVTFNSGCAGIAYWVNNYLKLSDGERIHEDHEAVARIKEWLDDQAEAGRFGEVADEEMLIQMRRHLPQYSS